MSVDNIRVKDIRQADSRTLGITWTDGKDTLFDAVELRRKCPCAVCIDEWTHEARLDPKSISDDVRPIRVDSVGRYAMQIKFTDGHGTGIYTFPMLRKLAGLSSGEASTTKQSTTVH